MGIHPNARLTPIGRERLIRQHLDEDTSLAQLAAGHVSANAPSASGWRAFVQAVMGSSHIAPFFMEMQAPSAFQRTLLHGLKALSIPRRAGVNSG